MKNTKKSVEWSEEEKRNIVGAFQILLDVDRRINPHLYKKIKTSPKSIENVPDKEVSIMSENS